MTVSGVQKAMSSRVVSARFVVEILDILPRRVSRSNDKLILHLLAGFLWFGLTLSRVVLVLPLVRCDQLGVEAEMSVQGDEKHPLQPGHDDLDGYYCYHHCFQ